MEYKNHEKPDKKNFVMNKIILSIAATTFLTGCYEKESPFFVDKINPQCTELKIMTTQFSKNPWRWKETFCEGDEIGLYVLNGKNAHFYTDSILYKNVQAKATKDANGNLYWTINPPVYLHLNPVSVIAYYPYQRHTPPDPGHLPLSLAFSASHRPDYRYGRSSGKQKRLNCLSPVAHLTMKRVLVSLSFRIRTHKETREDFHLEAIRIQAGEETALFSRPGVWEGNTGRIIPLSAATEIVYPTRGETRLSTRLSKEYTIRMIPAPRPTERSDIEVFFTINQQTYTSTLPRHTEWKKGYKYVYEVIFDGNHILLKQISCQFI